MTLYRHTQVGTFVIAVVGVAVLAIVAVLLVVGFEPVSFATVVFLLACLFLFGTLTVEVTSSTVRVSFGLGLVSKSFLVTEIQDARRVRNPWYAGFGIHRLEKGWLYNVSGLDAVELEMRDGRVVRIGTDRPDELLEAVNKARGLR